MMHEKKNMMQPKNKMEKTTEMDSPSEMVKNPLKNGGLKKGQTGNRDRKGKNNKKGKK